MSSADIYIEIYGGDLILDSKVGLGTVGDNRNPQMSFFRHFVTHLLLDPFPALLFEVMFAAL